MRPKIHSEMHDSQQIRQQRRDFFYQNYQMVWPGTKVLTKLERQLVDLSFGLSGEAQSHRHLAEKFQLKNQQQVNRIIHCALNKLRKEREFRLTLKQKINSYPPEE